MTTEPLYGKGSILAGRYELVAPLGEGAMGVVWEGRQTITGKRVAIKILKGKDPQDSARFLREARLAAALSHPNIVQVFDFWEIEGGGPVFMVMELLRGEPLSSLLVKSRRLNAEQVTAILLAVAQAIRAAHAEGVVHRDLKPENVFLVASGDGTTPIVKVLDFGIAKPTVTDNHATSLTHTGAVLGTPFYMAPEQIYGERDIDPRADIWAFGVLLYECLAGHRPFDGENYGQVFRAISHGTFRPLSEVVPECPPHLLALVEQCLTHDRGQRIASMDDVIAALNGTSKAAPRTVVISSPTVRLPQRSEPMIQHVPAATMVGTAQSISAPAMARRFHPGWFVAGGLGVMGAVGIIALLLLPSEPSAGKGFLPPLPEAGSGTLATQPPAAPAVDKQAPEVPTAAPLQETKPAPASPPAPTPPPATAVTNAPAKAAVSSPKPRTGADGRGDGKKDAGDPLIRGRF